MVDLFLGPKHDVEFIRSHSEAQRVTPQEIATFIMQDEIVAVYNGRSEAGPRALGNRSILYDPRDPDAKDIVNKVKRREKFRPFAASVMEEHAGDWFEMDRLNRCPAMSYAVPAKEDVYDKIPGVLHIDNTCRIQTVTTQQPHFHEVIEEFYKYTKIPMVLNTSFNLAGQPLVETPQDAIDTFEQSDIHVLWFPEVKRMIKKSSLGY
tara:strand:- start:155 stop:775 length:621 start_codon:yes stop_codon:yes gene_type:complete